MDFFQHIRMALFRTVTTGVNHKIDFNVLAFPRVASIYRVTNLTKIARIV